MHETHILETKNVGLYTWREGGGVWKSLLFVHSWKVPKLFYLKYLKEKPQYKYITFYWYFLKLCWFMLNTPFNLQFFHWKLFERYLSHFLKIIKLFTYNKYLGTIHY